MKYNDDNNNMKYVMNDNGDRTGRVCHMFTVQMSLSDGSHIEYNISITNNIHSIVIIDHHQHSIDLVHLTIL